MRGLLAAILMTSCARGWEANPTHHYHLQMGPDFSDDQSTAIVDAVTQWQLKSGDYVTFDLDRTAKSDVITIEAADLYQMDREFGGSIGESVFEGQSTQIYLYVGMDPVTFRQAALHEVGHALGLVHTGPGTIMCADTMCATREVTCGDLQQLEHRSICD